MTSAKLRLALLLAVTAAATGAGCAGNPAPKPGNASSQSSIEVQYESTLDGGAPAKPTVVTSNVPLDFWKGRSDLIKAPPPPQPRELALPPVQRWKLGNGLDVVVVARKDLPVVSFSMALRAGGYDEEKGKNLGVADFTAAMIRRGTAKRSADDISKAIDFVGGSLDTQAGSESSRVTCSSLAKDEKLCLDLLSDVVLRPSFPETEMAEVRDQVIAAINNVFDSPHELAAQHFDNLLFGEKHPDGWVLTPDDVQKITRAMLQDFWKTYYRPNNAILAVAGDVDAARLRGELEKAFGKWAPGEIPARPAFKVPELKATRMLLVDRPDLTQTTLMFGHRGIRHADPSWYAVTLMNYVLGGSDFSSRLMQEVRVKRGLTYGIGSSFGATLYEGGFRVSASTKNETAWEALVASVDEIRKMKQEGPTADELAKAKGYYAGSTPFALQTAAGVAGSIVAAELHGLGIPYVRELPVRLGAVPDADAKRAAADYLFPDTLLVVIVGKGDVIEPEIAKTGVRYERISFKDPISSGARSRLRKQQTPTPAPPPAPPAPAK